MLKYKAVLFFCSFSFTGPGVLFWWFLLFNFLRKEKFKIYISMNFPTHLHFLKCHL